MEVPKKCFDHRCLVDQVKVSYWRAPVVARHRTAEITSLNCSQSSGIMTVLWDVQCMDSFSLAPSFPCEVFLLFFVDSSLCWVCPSPYRSKVKSPLVAILNHGMISWQYTYVYIMIICLNHQKKKRTWASNMRMTRLRPWGWNAEPRNIARADVKSGPALQGLRCAAQWRDSPTIGCS